MHVEGCTADGYETVREVFERLVADGREVVRLTGGWADTGRTRPRRDDTLVMPYFLSLSKAFVTLAAEGVRRPRRGAHHPPPAAHPPRGPAAASPAATWTA
jgi:hypothetical protein